MPILTTPEVFSADEASGSTTRTASTRRLAYLVSHYPAISHTFILSEVRQLRREGFEISTASINACDRPSSQLPEIERDEEASTFYVKPAGIRNAFRSVILTLLGNPKGFIRGLIFTTRLGGHPKRFFYFIEALMLGMWMREKGMTHLHVHFGTAAATAAMLVSRTFPVTYSLTIHGPDEFYEVRKYYLAEKIAAAHFVCCIGWFARSQLMLISPSDQWQKFKVVPLGVDPDKFAPLARSESGTLEILCIGRLVAAKGQHILVSALKRLIQENRDVRLRFLGDGPERPSLERRIKEEGLANHIILEGAVNQDRIPEFLSNADVFALASFAEGVPVALMEAMAAEIPCVSTRITGIPELIRDEIDGLLVPPSDDEALAEALRRLADQPELRRQLGRAGRLRVIDCYNLEKNVSALAEVYRCHLP